MQNDIFNDFWTFSEAEAQEEVRATEEKWKEVKVDELLLFIFGFKKDDSHI